MIRVLALDLASTTGWAADGPDGIKPVGGTLKLNYSKDDNGEGLADCRDGVARLINLNKPTHVAIEAPVPVTSHGRIENLVDTAQTVRWLLGLVGVVEELVYHAGLECIEASAQDVRADFCGHRFAGKAGVMERLQQLGWSYSDNNEADAKALWYHVKVNLDPSYTPQRSVTIGRRAGT